MATDTCPPETTVIESPDGDDRLAIEIIWPETPIGEVQMVPCPCGFSLNFSNLIATRVCQGDFMSPAVWLLPNVAPCDFPIRARRICTLTEVCTKMCVGAYKLVIILLSFSCVPCAVREEFCTQACFLTLHYFIITPLIQ